MVATAARRTKRFIVRETYSPTAHAFGTDATDAIRFGRLEYMIGYDSDATAAFQFANNAAAGAGTGCTVRAGTMLRGIRLR